MNLDISQTDATSPVATSLIHELNAELNAMYDTEGGTGDFDPADVTVPRSAFVIAWVDGEAVGCGAIRPMEDNRYAEVKRMYVRPAFRGRGISRRVLIDLEQRARDFEYHYLQLETGVWQPEAIGLYESAGFYRIPNFGKYAGDDMSVCYKKELWLSQEAIVSIHTRARFITFVRALVHSYQTNPKEWENASIESYLEVLAGWTQDMDGYFKNNNLPVPVEPTWSLFAAILMAGK